MTARIALQATRITRRSKTVRGGDRLRDSRAFRHVTSVALASTLVVALTGCRPEEVAAPAISLPPVMVAPVEAWQVVDRVEATGELVAKDAATIAAQVGGEVTSVAIDEGDGVEAGQVLLEIDPERRELELRQSRARLTEASAAVSEARREMDRVGQLSARNAASTSQVDEAKTRLELAEARQRAARAQLGLSVRARSDSSVKAPFSGLVAERHVSPGEFLSPGQPLVRLVVLDPIEASFRLAEVDSGRVELGDPVSVRVAPHPGEVFDAQVSAISPTLDPRTRTLRVKAVLPNAEGRLRPGTFARVDLGVDERAGVTMIPEEAVLQRSDGSVVFRLKGTDRAERLRIGTGLHRDGYVEAIGPLAVGDRVIVRGQVRLIDGSKVSVRDSEGAPVVVGSGDQPEPSRQPGKSRQPENGHQPETSGQGGVQQ